MRKFFIFLMLISLSLALQANDKLSAPTQSFLLERAAGMTQQDGKQGLAKTKTVNGVETMDCFITLNSMAKNELEAKGVIITGEFDGFVTALIPINKVNEIANLSCVKQIGISRVAQHKTNVAKTITNAEKVWNGTSYGLPQAYKGENVVIGIIDGGIEFNHRAFKDDNGNSRVKVVYMPNASSGGSAASVNGVTFSGRQYTGSQISSLTTDDNYESHGTHTSSSAGGSNVNGYSGMAPGCDLVLCGLGSNMPETAIINSAKYIANYAQSVGKPCVISISLGTNTGPHDGSSSICKAYDQVANQFGAVILLAAGNEADATGYVSKTLSSTSDALVVLHESESGSATLSGYAVADFWTSNTSAVGVKVMVVNKSDGSIVSQSSSITSSTTVRNLSGFSNVNISVSISTSNGRRNIYIKPTTSGASDSNNRIAYVITGAAGTKIDGWTDGGYSSKFASSGSVNGYSVTPGQYEGTMCDDITGLKTISVGAQCTRNTSNGGYSQGDIAYWSSYGTDCNGNDHPFITAPGHYVIAALNGYDNYRTYYYTTSYQTTINGTTYYWGESSGTSMSTPIAAGVVALFLQADPTLNVDGVKDVIANTATAYSNPRSPAKQRGHGIINALAGMEYILGEALEAPVATSATNVEANEFTANWNACSGASSYTLRVQKFVPGPIFTETFAGCTSAGSQNISSNLDNYCDNSGWTGTSVFQAVGGVRMGTGSATGSVSTPALDLSNSDGKVYVKFNAQAYNNDTDCNLIISCGDASETVVLPNSEEAEYFVELDCAQAADQQITFATTTAKKRVILTSVEIYDNEPVEQTGDNEPVIVTNIAGTNFTVTGLEPLTTYVYDVKAVYSDGESGWSNQIKVTTLEPVPGTTLADILNEGVNGREYTVSNDLVVVDFANNKNYAFLTDVEGNWIMVYAGNTIFNQIKNLNVVKGGTLKGMLSSVNLNPVLSLSKAPQAGTGNIDYVIDNINLAEPFSLVSNQVIDVEGYWNAADGALRAYSQAPQGQSLTIDHAWGATDNTMQDGQRYIVRCAINLKEAWKTTAGISPKDYDYDFQNYIGRALRMPSASTAIETLTVNPLEIVNVYNMQGVMLKRGVTAGQATQGLPCGIYIVGNKKVVIK